MQIPRGLSSNQGTADKLQELICVLFCLLLDQTVRPFGIQAIRLQDHQFSASLQVGARTPHSQYNYAAFVRLTDTFR